MVTPSKTKFAVSIRNEGYACRVCVEGTDVARQLLACLSDVFVFKTSEPLFEGVHPNQCIFRVAYGPYLSHQKLVSLLSAIPGVRLMQHPA